MKVLSLLFLALGLTASLHAARKIEVSTQLIDVPAGTEAPATAEKLADLKSADLLSAPKLIVAENTAGKIEVSQPATVPGGGAATLGVSVEVKTRMTEKGNIWYSGVITDRSRSGGQKTERVETSSFAVRELYFSGWTTNGGTAVLRSAPATSQVTKNGKAVAQARELLVYMKFQTVSEPAAPAKKPATPAKKTPAKSKGKRA